jgi:endonuclease/exonuclease/phosphatase family metal-dependent hydrolase
MGGDVKDPNFFGLAWWNVNNYLHFRPEETGKGKSSRWPRTRNEYEEKSRRVDAALDELFRVAGTPQVLALGEISSQAAHDLRSRLLPSYKVLSLDVASAKPTAQIAVLYTDDSSSISFKEQPPIVVPRTLSTTRPMAVLDANFKDQTIRIIVCHWQARMDEKGSRLGRERAADYLSSEIFDFVRARPGKNHIAIIGDFNEEPYEGAFERLNAHRDRGRSLRALHRTDIPLKRLHLYNTAWRRLGEQRGHPEAGDNSASLLNCAGTYFWEGRGSWHHFDQLVVSGGLLGAGRPHLNEDQLSIVSSEKFLTNGIPIKFSPNDQVEGGYIGLSDHLPIYANIYI